METMGTTGTRDHTGTGRGRRRGLLATLIGAALAASLLIAPMAKAYEVRDFDGSRAEDQQTLDGYYDCVSWWFQDEGSQVQHVNTFVHDGEYVYYDWATDSSEDVWDGQGIGDC